MSTVEKESNKTEIMCTTSESLHGRRKILSDALQITDENVIEVLCKALNVHMQNRAEIVVCSGCEKLPSANYPLQTELL